MKKAAIVAFATMIVAGAATQAFGDGNLKISIDGNKLDKGFAASEVQSVKELVNGLGGLSVYDKKSGKIQVEKPDVNVMILEGIQQYKNKNIVFSNPIQGYGDKDVPRSFNVFVDVDNAPVSKELKVRLVLVGPDGNIVDKGKEWTYSTKNANSFYFSEPFISTKLEQYGTYTIQVRMKTELYNEYVVVGENSFTVGR
ncbi:MAG: hypothetical protein ACM32O_16025 [Clostridia bacterium]